MMRSDRLRHVAGALLLLLLATVVLTWPLVLRLSTHAVDLQDPRLNAWILAWEAHQLLRAPLHLFDANIFFPYDNTLAFSEILLSTSLLVMPLRWAGATALTTHNVAVLVSFFTTALGGYLLALHLTHSRAAGLLAGIAFAFSPYRMGHLSQVQLLASGWLPLTLLYLDRTLQNRTSYRRDATLFTFFFVVQALASFYAAFFTAAACLVYALLWWMLVGRLSRRAVGALTLGTLVAVLFLLPFALPYFAVQQDLGAGWSLAENETFAASLQAYLYAPARSPVWGALTERFHYVYGPCCPPDTLFPGVTVIVLAVVSLVRGDSRRRWIFAGLLLTGFVLSLGPTLKIRAGDPTGLRLPYYWLFTVVPGLDALRAPVRWALLVTLGLSLLAAWAVARRPRVAAIALALVVIEFAAVPLRLVEVPTPTPVVDWLDDRPSTRILELPLAADLPREDVPRDRPRRGWEVSRLLEYQYFSTWHWHTTPDGYSGYVPPRHGEFAREMESFPSARSIALLQGLGIEYVVLHEDDYPPARAREMRTQLDAWEQLEPVICFSGNRSSDTCAFPADRVLRVASAGSREELSWSLLVTGPAEGGASIPVWLTADVADIVTVPANERFPIRVTWQGPTAQTGTVEVQLPLVIERAAAVRLPVDAPTVPGTYGLHVDASSLPGAPQPLQAEVTVPENVEGEPPRLLAVTPADADVEALIPGETNRIELAWRALTLLDAYYSISVRVVTETGTVVAQHDGPPDSETPTVAWQPGQVYRATWPLEIPADAPASLHLEVLWYEPESGRQMLVWHDGAWQAAVRMTDLR